LNTPAAEAVKQILEKKVSRLLVTENEKPVGIISLSDFVASIADEIKSKRDTVGDVMSDAILVCRGKTPVASAARAMTSSGWRSVLVVDIKGKVLGVVSGHDLLRFVKEGVDETLTVRDVMHPALTIDINASLREAADMMIQNHYHRLVVWTKTTLMRSRSARSPRSILWQKWQDLILSGRNNPHPLPFPHFGEGGFLRRHTCPNSQHRRRSVIIGGGVGGASIAYHLTKLGWKDVLLVEKHELTSGSTWHSAGLVGQMRSDANLTRMMHYSTDLYRSLKAETGQDTSWREVGGIRLASSAERMEETKRLVGMARSFGVPMELISPKEAQDMFPLMDIKGVVGAAYTPNDGSIDPTGLTNALAIGAKNAAQKFSPIQRYGDQRQEWTRA
jgi:CBS domain-containing protein